MPEPRCLSAAVISLDGGDAPVAFPSFSGVITGAEIRIPDQMPGGSRPFHRESSARARGPG